MPPKKPEQSAPNSIEQQWQNIIIQQSIQPVNVVNIDVLPVTDSKVQLGKNYFSLKT